jgi:hypothetical protein
VRRAPLALAIVRDPFAPSGPGEEYGRPAALADAPDVAVPNIDNGALPAAQAAPAVVRATLVGAQPVAYVDDGTGMQIVRIGDVVGGRNVVAIDLRGVALADGTRLDLPGSARREPPPAAAPPARRTPSPHPNAQDVPDATRSPRSPPSESPPPLAATPAPLRTPDSRGLPPGVNPTPDAFGATPLPYPYPYAPPR